jgi:uncharacterized DUF497 family protein
MSVEHEFEWNENKAVGNFRKRGVAFETATEIFTDPFAIEVVDLSTDYDEIRFQIIGRPGGRLVTAIGAERGRRIRIISARLATRREHDRYHRENSQD